MNICQRAQPAGKIGIDGMLAGRHPANARFVDAEAIRQPALRPADYGQAVT
jgi:hypothetical protein